MNNLGKGRIHSNVKIHNYFIFSNESLVPNAIDCKIMYASIIN